MGALMKSGKGISEQYVAVIEWLNAEARPGGESFIWQTFATPEEAARGAKRLAAALRPQVRLAKGQRYSIRRSRVTPGGATEVLVFVYSEPDDLVRLPQGYRA